VIFSVFWDQMALVKTVPNRIHDPNGLSLRTSGWPDSKTLTP
jgi:hypothetical protein